MSLKTKTGHCSPPPLEQKVHDEVTVTEEQPEGKCVKKLTLRNGKVEVSAAVETTEIHGSYCNLTIRNSKGDVLLQEMGPGGALNNPPRHFQPIAGGDVKASTTFATPSNEHLYGMGLYQQDIMDLKGCELELAHRNSQASVPFVVSSAGYGFLWNNPAVGRAVFAKNHTSWHAESTRQLDYWVTVGDTPAQIESQYADATGHAPQMPEWGLGFWQCKLRYWNQQQVLDVAHEFKKRNIPLDLLVIDYFHWPKMGDYRFEEEFWPDPKAMFDELHKLGIKVMVSVWPQVSTQSENYEEMRGRNLLVRSERGVDLGNLVEEPNQLYDATNPETRAYVWEKCRKNYAELGADAFWLDEAEPEFNVYDFDNYRYHAGPVLQVGNIYPRDYNRGFYEGQIDMGRNGEIVNLTRCAWVGSQQYGALVWSGDIGSDFLYLRRQITAAIHMGMAGIPWFTTDMGGFVGGDIVSDSFKELLARWCQFSAFLPVMRLHGFRNKDGKVEKITAADGSHRCDSGVDNEPWSFGPEIEHVFRKFIGVREALRPYTRELFQQAHEDGQPIVRGLFYEFPDDEKAADVADEYLFGPDLLVAPVVQLGARCRAVYLPGDETTSWTSLTDGERYSGGQTVVVETPIDVVPVFARNGNGHDLAGLL
ncbi:TIM-barrel domain-containing protein [Bifidobacterium simiarum]|uniref:glycoside hydrolase family 31 protein n=1 Tax=Bifidobacterium simiarum TaxID=2045441 RepID=UPI001F0B255D|nr:TIM-barrel domain-containing protein [Bifidobacterium simiarum]